MKKNSKLLIIGISIFVIALAIGYALFSENISISGTAKAEGQLDLQITNVDVYGQISGGKTPSNYIDYDVEGTKITMTVNLTAPNDYFQITANIENHGSVDARLNNVDATPNFNRADICGLIPGPSEECGIFKDMTYYDEETGVYFVSALADMSNVELNSTDIVIPAGDTSGNYQMIILTGWSNEWDTAITESHQITFTVDFGFIQSNKKTR